jgi:polyphosphate kinase 2
MDKLLKEIYKINKIITGEPINEGSTQDYVKRIKDVLSFNNMLTPNVEQNLSSIIKMGDERIIDFELLDRGLKKVLLKKGNKKKSVENYFDKVVKSLKNRETDSYNVEPESDDYSFEPQEPSIVPKKIYRKELFGLQVELLKLQEWLSKNNKTVIIVFEGRDSAGKGSTIKKFIENMNPRGYKVIAMGIPTPEERKNWWQRYESQIEKGKINLFDRSWYNRGLVEPVMGYGSDEEYQQFMDGVEDFENSLIKDGDFLFKLWFSIDKETQAKRFDMRQKSPLKYWKYSPNDSRMQDLWDRFTEFKEKLFDKTSTMNHPWVILDAIDKKISGLNAIRYVLQNIPYEGKNENLLNKEYPEALTVLKPEN